MSQDERDRDAELAIVLYLDGRSWTPVDQIAGLTRLPFGRLYAALASLRRLGEVAIGSKKEPYPRRRFCRLTAPGE